MGVLFPLLGFALTVIVNASARVRNAAVILFACFIFICLLPLFFLFHGIKRYHFNYIITPYDTIVNRGCGMFFKKIYDLRIDNDKTQQQIADMLVCNRQVYARYEKGIREIPISMLIKLAKYYNVSIDYLVGLTDSKRR
jgi:DNA-binding XRE family transcriptional regulator